MTSMTTPNPDPAEEIRAELEATHRTLHTLLATLSEEDFRRSSLNPGWTNGEILAHMLFGLLLLLPLVPLARVWGRLPRDSSRWFAQLLNAATGPFNRVNAWGARGQARVFTRQRIGKLYDRIHAMLLRMVAQIDVEEWSRGMYYPTRWDDQFSDFMTLEALFRYAIRHFEFHRRQLALPTLRAHPS